MICTLRKRGRLYYARVRLGGWSRPRYFALGVSDKQVAQQMLADKIRKLERQAVGILPSDTVLDGSAQPVLGLLAAFLGDVKARGRAANTVRLYRLGIIQVCGECGWTYLREISRDGFERWRAAVLAPVATVRREGSIRIKCEESRRVRPAIQIAAGHYPLNSGSGVPPHTPRSANTINHILGYLKTFLVWCADREFIERDRLRLVKPVRIKAGRGCRRALSAAELAHFFASVPAHRMAVYATAYYAGLRRKEMNKLKRGDFQLDGPRPFVRVPGIAAKNGETQDVPLHRALVAILRSYWSLDTAPFAWAFYGHVPNMDTWRRDLERAGIPYKDAEGRRFDFHASRMTLNTHLREARVGLEDRMAILRWSDPRLAGETYMDERQISVAAEVAKLPDFGGRDRQTARSGALPA